MPLMSSLSSALVREHSTDDAPCLWRQRALPLGH